MSLLGSGTLIGEEQTILLWAVVLVIVAVSIVLEQRFKWAASLGALVFCIFLGLACSNLGIVPHSSPVYTGINNVVLLCAIPLFLFKANVVRILKDSGKLFILFHIAAVGTLVGVVICFGLFRAIENVPALLTVLTAGAVGGTVNCIAMGSVFQIPDGLMDSYLVIANIECASLIIVFRLMHNTKLVRNHLLHPHTDKFEEALLSGEADEQAKTTAGAFWGGKEIGLKDLALALATTFAIVGISSVIANWVVSLNPPTIIAQLFGSVYLIMTIVTVTLATVFHKFFGNIKGTMELGNIGLLAWFVTIGISGNLVEIVKNGALALLLLVIVSACNILFSMVGAKLIKANWEDVVNATTATIGGPPTAAAASVSFGWSDMVVPGILVGLWGYVIGSYFGIFAGNLMGVASLF